MGKQTIYRWWPSKGAVLLDAFLDHRVEERSDVAVLDPFDTGDLAADVRRILRDTVRAFASPAWEAPYRAMTVAIQDDPDLAAQVSARIVQPSLDDVRTWLAAARDRGDVRPDIDLDVAVEVLLAPIFHRWLLRTGPLTDAYADALADAAVYALRAALTDRERNLRRSLSNPAGQPDVMVYDDDVVHRVPEEAPDEVHAHAPPRTRHRPRRRDARVRRRDGQLG